VNYSHDLSRADDELSRDLSRRDEPEGPYEVPPLWNAGHVAHRLIHAFDVLMATTGRIAPSAYGGGWPTALREFSDLIDEQAMKAARDAFAENLRRPTAEEISMSDEALAWPMTYASHEPMACDAVLLWAMCKAGGFSIAGVLRERNVKAKAMAARMATAELQRAKAPLLDEARALLARAQDLKARGESDPEIGRQGQEIKDQIQAIRAPLILPWQALPEKILSRTSLDRYLPAGLSYLAEQLHRAHVPVR
jgi:hypothetical protein